MRIIFGFLSFLFLLAGCSPQQTYLSTAELEALALRAASGVKTADDSLGNIFSRKRITGIKTISADTITITGRKFYALVVQAEDPRQNRFAVYDEKLECFLIDRSLNGTLSLDVNRENKFQYFSLYENFVSNDSIILQRFTMYRGDSSGFNLAFRAFTEMRTSDTVFKHDLYEIAPDIIRTRIIAPLFSGINNLNDDYPYDPNSKAYFIKKAVYFDAFVSDFVNSIKDEKHKFLIPASLKEREDVSSVFEQTSSTTPDYYISLNEDWKELRNKPGGSFLKREITGSKYINKKLGSDIYVFRIPYYEKAELYVDAAFEGEVAGNYTVRFSKELTTGEIIKKYFEYSCKTKKYLLVFSAATESYKTNSREYFDIINTFYINC